MDLKNYTVTLGELLENPRARTLLIREFPAAMHHPMYVGARQMQLKSLLVLARRHLPPQKLQALLRQLQAA